MFALMSALCLTLFIIVVGSVTRTINDNNVVKFISINIPISFVISLFAIVKTPDAALSQNQEIRTLITHIVPNKGKYIFKKTDITPSMGGPLPWNEEDVVSTNELSSYGVYEGVKSIMDGKTSFTITSASRDGKYFFIKTNDGLILRVPLKAVRNLVVSENKTHGTGSKAQKDFADSL